MKKSTHFVCCLKTRFLPVVAYILAYSEEDEQADHEGFSRIKISLESSLSAMIQETVSQMQESNNRMRLEMAKEVERLRHNTTS